MSPRRAAGSVVVAVTLLTATGTLWQFSPAKAQSERGVRMGLVRQSPWNGPNRPLTLDVRVANDSADELGQLSLVLVIQAPARSRSLYNLSLKEDATPPIFALPFVQQGVVRPNESRRFSIKQDLAVLAAREESALYPVKLQLLSGDVPVAEIRTPMIFLIEKVELPLRLAWTWELSTPLQYTPTGRFQAGTLEGDIAPGGRIASIVATLERLGDVPLDLVPSPAMLDQLQRMADGYEIANADGSVRDVPAGTGGATNAATLLESLRAIGTRPDTEVLALPLADASLAALLRAGLDHDAVELLAMGRDVVAEAVGRVPRGDVYRPPSSELDATTLAMLARSGVQTVVVDDDYVPASPGLNLSPSPLARLVAGRVEATAVRSDGGVTSAARTFDDPRLSAQAALGELAATWLELPGTPGRGVSLVLPGRRPLSPAFLASFAKLVRSSPWLDPVIVSRLPALVTRGERRTIPPRNSPGLSTAYVDRLLAARSSLNQFARAVPGAADRTAELRARLLTSLGGTFLKDPSGGERFIDSVAASIRKIYSKVRIGRARVTLASRSGIIPVTLENTSGFPMEVTVRLIADRRIAFTDGNSRHVTLPAETRSFTFPVQAQTTGRFPIKIQVRTPVDQSIAETIAEAQIVVRSTAYNRVALFVTAGAALFLLVWWGRRLLPRRKAREP